MRQTQLNSTSHQPQVVRTSLALQATAMLSMTLQAGDELRSERGTTWITIDGRPDDIVLQPGDTYRVPTSAAFNLSALDSACVSVLGRRPLTWRRVRPDTPRGWAAVRHWAQRVATALGHGSDSGHSYNRRSAAAAAGR